ncbi:hypothetical protein FNV43_RR13798 [Rhamnella rubrinervis]|uniref:Uncharacterized protein n=1 Tax=Rhamnella rubrinervis TaxID=2594499 RepID=A0A8K0H1V0_9ROSA|nr:hypothetical protein FNV43_RR13798 [Rhamnella rubrinervis]
MVVHHCISFSIRPWEDSWIPWIENFIPKTKEGIDGFQRGRVADLRLDDGSDWNIGLLREICEEDTVEAIRRIIWPQQQIHDELLLDSEQVRQKIAQRIGQDDLCCVFCGLEAESGLHLFKDCHPTSIEPESAYASVKAFAPATIANFGPDFDFFGCAVDGFGDFVSVSLDPHVHPGEISISEIFGDNANKLSKNPLWNCAGIAASEVMKMLGVRSVGLSLSLEKGLPLGSGLDRVWQARLLLLWR